MAEDSVRHAYVVETKESDFCVDIDVSGHHIKGDEPESGGGKNLGPAPYDMLLAALGECTAMTVRWYALQQKWPLDKIEVKLTHAKESQEGRNHKTDVFTKQITLHGPQLTEEQCIKLHEVASKCPVQRTLEGTPAIRTLHEHV